MSATAYFLVSILTLTNGQIAVETKDTKFPTEVACMVAALQAEPFLQPTQLPVCDPGGPDIPTRMETSAGE